MANTKSITAATRAEVKRLRGEIAEIDNNIADMTATACRIGDRYGWDDARLALIDADEARIRIGRQALVAQINALLGKTTAQAAA